jgi:hypothetical protein
MEKRMNKELQVKEETAGSGAEGEESPSGPALCAMRYTLISRQDLNNRKKQKQRNKKNKKGGAK